MRLCKDLIGKPIITINDGRMIGKVKDVFLDGDLSTMTGILLRIAGLIRRKQILITAESVVVFGIDAILVKDGDVVTDNKTYTDAANWIRLDKLSGREVDTPGGTRVGVIGDVVLDESAKVLGYAFSRVFVEGPIAKSRMVYRHAVIDDGSLDNVMTVDLMRAESAEPLPEKQLDDSSLIVEGDEIAADSDGETPSASNDIVEIDTASTTDTDEINTTND
ncbi:MAG: PRC-barrel domain-containing protein [Methylococcales bacterium]|nr:PRC-barrel domain-containing protein [Methylococcales bacterium]